MTSLSFHVDIKIFPTTNHFIVFFQGGKCPKLPRGAVGTCVEACGLNGRCPKGELCCSNGCGHTCQKAVFGGY